MGNKTIWEHLTVEAIERVIDKAIYIHNNEYNGPDEPIYHGPWSIQPGHHRRDDIGKAILALIDENAPPEGEG